MQGFLSEIIIALILINSFSIGIFQALGLPMYIPKAVTEILTIFLFFGAVCLSLQKNRRMKFFNLLPIVGVAAAGLFSGAIHDVEMINRVLFLRSIAIFYLLFLAVRNIHIPSNSILRLLFLIIFLFAIQIPVSWLKFFTLGIDEPWIGTVHMSAGSLSLLIPMFANSFLFAAYLYRKRISYAIWMVLFFIFGIIGDKRAIVFMMPALFVFLLHYYYASSIWPRNFTFFRAARRMLLSKNILLLITIVVAIFYVGGRMIPTLNPEEKVGGSFNISHILNYSIGYNLKTFEDLKSIGLSDHDIMYNDGAKMGRFRVIYESTVWIAKQDLFTSLCGLGGGALSHSYLTENKYDVMFLRLGIRGTIPFMTYILLECGIIGFLCFVIFFIRFYLVLRRMLFCASDKNEKWFILGMIGVTFTFIFDSFVYSCASMTVNVLTPIFYFLMAILLEGNAKILKRFTPQNIYLSRIPNGQEYLK